MGIESSILTPDVSLNGQVVDLIQGGAARGNNLFHSFLDFNVDLGKSVYFDNPAATQAIFSRVTGNDVSEIFGTLGVAGSADLFLLNPNGILFGENAKLDISGSFRGDKKARKQSGAEIEQRSLSENRAICGASSQEVGQPSPSEGNECVDIQNELIQE